MSKKAFDQIAAGLKEAIAIAEGKADPATYRVHVPAEIDVLGLRNKLGLSQEGFASAYHFSVSQIRQWEQRRCQPTGAMRAYLTTIKRDPQGIAKLLQAPPARSRRQSARAGN